MKVPGHFWAVGTVALIWNAGGAFDYVMTQVGVEAYLAQVPDVQVAWIKAAPAWFKAFWALSVWGAVLGSVALLLRSRHAVSLFGLAVVGYLGASLYSVVLAEPPMTDLMGSGSLIFTLAIAASLVGFWAYARAMKDRMILR